MVPGNCTDRLQPLDVSVNKPAKDFLRAKFQQWYSDKIRDSLDSTNKEGVVDLKLSVVKPLGAQWLMDLYDYMLQKPELIINGFCGAGNQFNLKGKCNDFLTHSFYCLNTKY